MIQILLARQRVGMPRGEKDMQLPNNVERLY